MTVYSVWQRGGVTLATFYFSFIIYCKYVATVAGLSSININTKSKVVLNASIDQMRVYNKFVSRGHKGK